MKVLITIIPFGNKNKLPLDLLKKSNIEYVLNPLNKKPSEEELAEMIKDFDAIIAGTEKISKNVINNAKKLKHISRVGIGLDSIDLLAAEKKGIKVSYTPDIPSPAIAELTIGMMLTLLRSTHVSNSQMHLGQWHRVFGRSMSNISVGLIGVGRVGSFVIKYLQGFKPQKILANDVSKSPKDLGFNVEWVEKDQIFKEADILSLHLPLTSLTKNLIKKEQLMSMKKDSIVINTSRGGIINEKDLYNVMKTGHLSGAAIDVFENEPYEGPLKNIERCLMTSHIGSMTYDCRAKMEIEATEEIIRFLTGKPLEKEVPKLEFETQRERL